MPEVTHNKLSNLQGLVRLIIGILVFGSIWGLLEATLGGFLHMIIFPNKGAIMSGIGVAIMASALAVYRKPAMLPGMGIVAASFKLLGAWVTTLSLTGFQAYIDFLSAWLWAILEASVAQIGVESELHRV